MHGLAVHVKEGLPFAQDLTLENSADSYVCFQMALLHLMSYFFFPYQSPSWPLCSVFDAISSNIHEVLSMNPSANVFVFAWYEEAPPIFRASGSPPLAFQDHSVQKV